MPSGRSAPTRSVALSILLVLVVLVSTSYTSAAVVETAPPVGPVQARTVPVAGQTWEELRAIHRERAHWLADYYDARPGPRALRAVLEAYEDWIESLFDQTAIAESAPYAAALEKSHPTDVPGIRLIARFRHFAQRFDDESDYLLAALDDHPPRSRSGSSSGTH